MKQREWVKKKWKKSIHRTLRIASNILLNQQVFNIFSTWCWYENQLFSTLAQTLTLQTLHKWLEETEKCSCLTVFSSASSSSFAAALIRRRRHRRYATATMMEHIYPINKRKARLIHAFPSVNLSKRAHWKDWKKTSKKCDLYTLSFSPSLSPSIPRSLSLSSDLN